MIPEAVWYAAGVSAAAGLLTDIVVHAIQQWQRKRADMPREEYGPLGAIPFSLLTNSTFSFLFSYVYNAVAAGSGRAFIAGGLIWLIIVLPMLASSHYADDRLRGLLLTRVFGWLIKIGAASAAIHYFIT
jgi:hypothetical protein